MTAKKMYSVKELADILGCSATAVNKKISADPDNPSIKRYRNHYDAVINDGKTVILLSDEELEQEKRLSKGFKNVQNNVNETPENVIDAEFEPETPALKDDTVDKILKFADGYIERYETLQKRYYDLLNEKDKQVKLLTDSEHETQKKYYETEAKNKELLAKAEKFQEEITALKRYLIISGAVIIVITALHFIVIRTF